MNLDDIQAFIREQILASAELAALGQPLIYSHFTPDEDARLAINERLADKGVCVEIGTVEAQGETEKPNNRYSLVTASFDVFVAESPEITHTPAELALVRAVARAVQARRDSSAPAITCNGYGGARSENGYVLHVLSFSMPAFL